LLGLWWASTTSREANCQFELQPTSQPANSQPVQNSSATLPLACQPPPATTPTAAPTADKEAVQLAVQLLTQYQSAHSRLWTLVIAASKRIQFQATSISDVEDKATSTPGWLADTFTRTWAAACRSAPSEQRTRSDGRWYVWAQEGWNQLHAPMFLSE
jgi:hypothetical protein